MKSRKMRIIIPLVLMLLFTCCYAERCECESRKNDDINIVKNNLLAAEVVGYSPGDVHNTARMHIDSMNKYGFWDDIDYNTQPGTMFPATQHINRLVSIARAYVVPNQPLFQSEEVMQVIEKALPHVEKKILKQMPDGALQALGNWWFWNLYIPPRLGTVLLIADGHINERILNTSINTLYFCLTNPFDFYLNGMTGDGANSVNAIKGNIYYAVLTNNNEGMRKVSDAYKEALKIVNRPNDGLRTDAAYTQHVMIDFYQYFNDYVIGTIGIQNYLKGSNFAPTPDEFDEFAYVVCEGATWAMYQRQRDMAVGGRVFMPPFTEAQVNNIIAALRLVSENECSYQEQAKELLARHNSGFEMKTGHKHFYQADYTVHKTDESYVSLRMASSRTKAAEAWSGQGFTTLFMSDGYMQIYDDAAEFFDGTTWACVDYTKLAGITNLRNHTPILFDASHWAAEPFVGGASDGKYGVSAMNLSQISMPLFASKSWFFFDDEVVCLGSGIESDDVEEVHTYVDERPEKGGKIIVDGKINNLAVGNSQELKDVSWIHNNGIGYFFPKKADLNLEKENREGSWKMLNSNSDGTMYNADFSYLWFNHGSKPKNASYSYAVLPSVTSSEVKDYAEKENFEILEQSDRIHAVYDKSTDTTGIVFWPEDNDFLEMEVTGESSKYDGIFPRAAGPRVSKTVLCEVKGKKGTANEYQNYGLQGFAVSEQRAASDVDITVTWFDDRNASSGSWWHIRYTDSNGDIKTTETIPYKYTDEWQETVLHIPDIKFDGSVNDEASVEFAIIHSNNEFNTMDKKYGVVTGDSAPTVSATDTLLYGPIIHKITINPHGRMPKTDYSATIDGISTDCPCILYKKPIDGGMEIYISEPTQQGKKVTLTVDGSYSVGFEDGDVSVSALKNGKTRISIDTAQGRTYKIKLKNK